MKHLRPLVKAELTWFDSNPLSILATISQVLVALTQVLVAVFGAKEQPAT